MPITTASAALHITPVVLKTLFEHNKRKAIKASDKSEEEALDDVFFDQAFHIVKAFILLGTKNTVESLQAYTNTHVPAPYWAAVSPVCVPFHSCNRAADILIDWFGPQDLHKIVGGERWWQVRGLDGVEGEWVTEASYLSEKDPNPVPGRTITKEEGSILRMEHLKTVMLYVHGGGYFWGSINTHRYQIIRYARKMKGRVFAVNYRKAPQYPWPCALQDVLAAYLYLVEPPPNALHNAVLPSNIVIAGDSAGAALCLNAMTVLRDMKLPLPAGAVLISPWVDLTHSFPSVMENAQTDIIPSHGFLAKPSTLWPIHPIPPDRGRVVINEVGPSSRAGCTQPPGSLPTLNNPRQHESFRDDTMIQAGMPNGSSTATAHRSHLIRDQTYRMEPYDVDLFEPKPPKILMGDLSAPPMELNSQIQLYATTEQLTHPLVSPVLQGSLGNLPPLYIIAGDGEMLRDEIIYLAHRAAYPAKYPVRMGILRDARRQQENSEKFTTPTKVHLQVFDDMCHALTVFTFSKSAKYAYESIAKFAQHVTSHTPEFISHSPFPKVSTKPPGCHSENERPGVSNPHEANKPTSDSPMVRQRVDIHGRVRAMEPEELVPALQLAPREIGIMKEAPAVRWKAGQDEWDRRYKQHALRVIKQRAQIEVKVERVLERARTQGLVANSSRAGSQPTNFSKSKIPALQMGRRWGPLDLAYENPPPTAIANRRDTPEALALLKKTIYATAPITHQNVPKLMIPDAAGKGQEHRARPSRYGVPEEQVRTNPLHGLRIWDGIITYFAKKTSQGIVDGVKEVTSVDISKTI